MNILLQRNGGTALIGLTRSGNRTERRCIIFGWGYYKLILALDDYSRKILSWTLQPSETARAISEAVEGAIENTGMDQVPEEQKPALLTDNGSGFTSNLLADYLKVHGIRHIFGKPYHPQTQ